MGRKLKRGLDRAAAAFAALVAVVFTYNMFLKPWPELRPGEMAILSYRVEVLNSEDDVIRLRHCDLNESTHRAQALGTIDGKVVFIVKTIHESINPQSCADGILSKISRSAWEDGRERYLDLQMKKQEVKDVIALREKYKDSR